MSTPRKAGRGARESSSAEFISARQLSAELSPRIGADFEQIFDALTFIPENMLSLLETPDGWAMLGQFVAGELDCSAPSYFPTSH